MVILFFGDIYARPGRTALRESLPFLREKFRPDFIIGNAENLAGGRGVTIKTFEELIGYGFHGLTSGNHIWDNKEVFEILARDHRLLRPANYPDLPGENCPGKGHAVLENNGQTLHVINLMGRTFMGGAIDCPFRKIDALLEGLPKKIPILVDMHAETTSEKSALGWYLDGRVSAVLGTHTHVQTSDEGILPKGTAFLTDVGMTGSFDSCIGSEPHGIILRFMTSRSLPKQEAEGNLGVGCAIIHVDEEGRAESILRLRFTLKELEQGAQEWMRKSS